MSNSPKRDTSKTTVPDPGANQAGINDQQGKVNDKQGDVNDEVLSELSQRQDTADASTAASSEQRDAEHIASEARHDQAEADAVATGEKRDAEHVASESRQDDSDTRQDESEAAAAAVTEKRDAQFVAQATMNADQAVINAQAVSALLHVGEVAQNVTDLLRENVERGRTWTVRLALVVLALVFLGLAGAWKFQSVTDTANHQRERLERQADESDRQAAILKAQVAEGARQRDALKTQAAEVCTASAARDSNVKKELNFLVKTATEGSTNPSTIEFRKTYPAHLDEVIPTTPCTQRPPG